MYTVSTTSALYRMMQGIDWYQHRLGENSFIYNILSAYSTYLSDYCHPVTLWMPADEFNHHIFPINAHIQ